jgi:hypothetical protein
MTLRPIPTSRPIPNHFKRILEVRRLQYLGRQLLIENVAYDVMANWVFAWKVPLRQILRNHRYRACQKDV